MVGRQIVYAISAICAFIFFLLYPPWISWYILVLILLLLPFDFIISLPGMLTKTIRLSAPTMLEQNSVGALRVIGIHKSIQFMIKTLEIKIARFFPVSGILVRFQVTGDDFSAKCKILCTGGHEDHGEIAIDTSKTGLTVFNVKKYLTISLIGLISFRYRAPYQVSVLIMPPAKKPTRAVALPRGLILRPKPGGGYSEDHDMRKYLPGDPVKSIHWKLSAKYDSLIIREPLVPPNHSRLVQVVAWTNAEERDLTLSHLRWVTDYLHKWDMSFYIKYSDNSYISEVRDESDLFEFLRHVLNKDDRKRIASASIPKRFSWIYHVSAEEAHQ
ncbi:MAG: DUF58 domain-containing protein [Oscillospiraceae bacterium]|jgi:hypothetical protein|nr:DUF58 domain-containing protein [Oscillospiraceae bacterium]